MKVQIIAPSSGVTDADILAKNFAALLEQNNFKVKTPAKNICTGFHFYSNPLEKRFEDFEEALLDPEVDILWSLRGGYGASEVAIKCLDIKPSHPKIFIGFSDGTVLHRLFNDHYGMPSIHGSGGSSLMGNQSKHMGDIVDILNGNDVVIDLEPMTIATHNCALSGKVTGGNLTLLMSMTGTKLAPITKDRILLLEDVGEKGYQVRRALNHLNQAGLLDNVKAIVLGDFTNSDEHLDFALEDFCTRNEGIPIFRAKGVGHGDTNIPLPFGTMASIKDKKFIVRSGW